VCSLLSRGFGGAAVGAALLYIMTVSIAWAEEAASPISSARADIRAGRSLAKHYCSQCHAIGRTGKSRHPDAPAFRTLSERYPIEALAPRFAQGISTSHADMLEWRLDLDQNRDLLAYLQSVQSNR
jgi:cytochrome c553